MWQNTTVRAMKKPSHEPISPSSIPLPPHPLSFFYVQFSGHHHKECVLKGCILEELICLTRLNAAPSHTEDQCTKRKALDLSLEMCATFMESHPSVTLSQHQQTPHDALSPFYFENLNQFVSSALTSCPTSSRVIILVTSSTSPRTLVHLMAKMVALQLSDHIGEVIAFVTPHFSRHEKIRREVCWSSTFCLWASMHTGLAY